MYVSNTGTMTIKNHTTGEVCLVDFKQESGWGKENRFGIDGYTYNSAEESKESKKKRCPTHHITGTWTGGATCQVMKPDGKAVDPDAPIYELWKTNPFPEQSHNMYNMSQFSLQINYLPEGLKEKLPPTDSRLRPD